MKDIYEKFLPWQSMDNAPTTPKTGVRGPIIIAVDKDGNLGRTAWCHKHHKGSNVWLLFTGQGLEEWEPVLWVSDPLPVKVVR